MSNREQEVSPVHVFIYGFGQVVVDNELDLLDVETAGRYGCGYQNRFTSAFKVV